MVCRKKSPEILRCHYLWKADTSGKCKELGVNAASISRPDQHQKYHCESKLRSIGIV